jgi:hypothetical protein
MNGRGLQTLIYNLCFLVIKKNLFLRSLKKAGPVVQLG